jgi:hypothetical protein
MDVKGLHQVWDQPFIHMTLEGDSPINTEIFNETDRRIDKFLSPARISDSSKVLLVSPPSLNYNGRTNG